MALAQRSGGEQIRRPCGGCGVRSAFGRNGTDGIFYCENCWDHWMIETRHRRALETCLAEQAAQAGPQVLADGSQCHSCGTGRRDAGIVGHSLADGRWFCPGCAGNFDGSPGDRWYHRWIEVRWGSQAPLGAHRGASAGDTVAAGLEPWPAERGGAWEPVD
mmetsp:Transcript_56136/g.159363  ORF Transcript_56136/g.159363 Transcript_56136/m.159363 type:complete len:161 (-) Transcript_56136:145-627(-)